MRRPLRRLKNRLSVADDRTMAPGGRLASRRGWALVAFAASLTLLLLITSAHASTATTANHERHAVYLGGEAGTGMPAPAIARTPLTERAASIKWSDVSSKWAWARPAINAVAASEDWMRDFPPNRDGTYPFRPGKIESRKRFARSLVRAFAPAAEPDSSIRFSDLDRSSRFWSYANVAVQRGWLTRKANGDFMPDKAVRMATVHRALVLALGLRRAARSLDKLHTADGRRFKTPKHFGTTVLGMRLFLRYNSARENRDVLPWTPMPRAQVAYSLWRAASTPEYAVEDLRTQYGGIELPWMGKRGRAIVNWGVRYAGYPYIWGGEWGRRAPEPSALGGQPIPGFDCSGLTWWLLRMNDSSAWRVAPPRPYRGWSLPQRTSADMAHMTPKRLRYRQLRPGDLMFYDGDGNGVTDHVDTYVGNGFAIDSSSTPGGVTLMRVGKGWYRDHFLFGRRVLPR
jgi:hypothetical protein